MSSQNTNLHFASRRHSLYGVTLTLVPYRPKDGRTQDRCAFCASTLAPSGPEAEPVHAFTSPTGHWVCQTCFCEYKDDFDWPTSE